MGGRLEGKVAVITGGASGMGKSTVARFLADGASVVIGDLNEENGKAALDEFGTERCDFVRTDVAEEADVAALVARSVERFGRLDCIFNNAGVGGVFGPIGETDTEGYDYTMAVLVRSVFLGMKHAAPIMQRQGQGGSIISTASIAAITGGNGAHIYSAAKAAVIGLTRSVALEMAPHRIRVNAIAPGVIETPLLDGGRPGALQAVAQAKMLWPRLGTGDDIAAMAAFLASDDGEFVSGQVMVVDGALTAQGSNLWNVGGDGPLMRNAGVNRGSTGQESEVRRLSRD